MPGVSKKTPLAYWADLMDRNDWQHIRDMERATGLAYSTLYDCVYRGTQPSLKNAKIIAAIASEPIERILIETAKIALELQLERVS